jgi:hypothetical protein
MNRKSLYFMKMVRIARDAGNGERAQLPVRPRIDRRFYPRRRALARERKSRPRWKPLRQRPRDLKAAQHYFLL